jgi:tRNA threonylcarbamoyladenosine biosynthesis protein TsaE
MYKSQKAANLTVETSSPEATEKIGADLVSKLEPNDVVALYGELGSGKTCFVKGIARGLNVSQPVKSPSFNIINEYPGVTPLYHIDFYRLAKPAEIEETGWMDCLDAGGIVVIEWAERVKNMLPYKRIDVYFEVLVNDTRRLEIIAVGSSGN